MPMFCCVPIETEIADRFRRTGLDDKGNALRRMEASNASGFPCRHCLRCAAPGEAMLLGSYNLPRPRGIYWTPSPIFVHAGACERFAFKDEIAPIVRLNTLVSVRAYDASDQCIYELGQVCSGGATGFTHLTGRLTGLRGRSRRPWRRIVPSRRAWFWARAVCSSSSIRRAAR